MLLEILDAAIEGAEIGSSIGGLFDSEHADDYNNGVTIYQNIDWENINDSEVRAAISCFEKVTPEDKLYVQCFAWYNLSFCYCALKRFSDSYSCLAKIDNADIDFFTFHKDDINEIKSSVPEARKSIKEFEQEIKEEEERKRKEEERRRIEENRKMEMLTQSTGAYQAPYKSQTSIPTWIIIFIVLLSIAVSVLVCYIIFK